METTINGARIHYKRSGAGFPAVFLHAGVADSRMWEPQVAAFEKHFDVIRPDQRGYGGSELPPCSWSPVGDVLALMDELALKPVHLIGCSMGSALAIDFALDHPARVSKLVLVGPTVGGAKFGGKYPELWTEVDAAEDAHDLVALSEAEARLWLDGPKRRAGHVEGWLRELFMDMNGIGLKHDFDSAPREEVTPAAVGRLHEITALTLVVVGDEDIPPTLDAVELLMEQVNGARKAIIHDAAHLPNLEHPEEFNRLVLDFLLS